VPARVAEVRAPFGVRTRHDSSPMPTRSMIPAFCFSFALRAKTKSTATVGPLCSCLSEWRGEMVETCTSQDSAWLFAEMAWPQNDDSDERLVWASGASHLRTKRCARCSRYAAPERAGLMTAYRCQSVINFTLDIHPRECPPSRAEKSQSIFRREIGAS